MQSKDLSVVSKMRYQGNDDPLGTMSLVSMHWHNAYAFYVQHAGKESKSSEHQLNVNPTIVAYF